MLRDQPRMATRRRQCRFADASTDCFRKELQHNVTFSMGCTKSQSWKIYRSEAFALLMKLEQCMMDANLQIEIS